MNTLFGQEQTTSEFGCDDQLKLNPVNALIPSENGVITITTMELADETFSPQKYSPVRPSDLDFSFKMVESLAEIDTLTLQTNTATSSPVFERRELKRTLKATSKSNNRQTRPIQVPAVIGEQGCPRCLQNRQPRRTGNAQEKPPITCDVGLKAIFRRIRQLSNSMVEMLNKPEPSLRESLAEKLAVFAKSHEDADQLATLVLAFHSVHHQSVDEPAYFLDSDRDLVQLVHNICYKWNKHHQANILHLNAFKLLLKLPFFS